MDTYRCIVTKREIRTFTEQPIADDHLRQILNAGRMSGSSRNRQPWHFIIVRDRARLRTLSQFGRFAQHVATAAVAIGVVVDGPAAMFDAGRCVQNMMLAAWNAGIASCPASMHQAEEARAFLKVPEGYVLATVLSFGSSHPKGRGTLERATLRILTGRGRRPLQSMVSGEWYGGESPGI